MLENNKEYQLARSIVKLANTIIKNRNRHLQELDLTAGQADSLQFFYPRQGAAITDLKEHLGITHQTARGIVQRLEAKGLVLLQKSDKDARFQQIFLTSAGQQTVQILHNSGIRTGHKLLYQMTEAEQEIFTRLLNKAAANLNQATAIPMEQAEEKGV